jgi:tetratricopeptide (TPR) repeat protein
MDALEQERFSEAVALFEETLASDPSMMNKVSAPYARALQGQASKLAKTDPYKAKTLLLKAVELDPGSLHAHFQLGLLYARLKNYPKAIDRYEKAAELDPQFSETFFNLGYVYAINKNYSRAKEMYGRVVELAPRFVDEALFNLAIVHDKLGDRDKCVRTLKKAIIANPANESAKKYLQRLKGK